MAERQSLSGRMAGGAFEGLESFGSTLLKSALTRKQNDVVTARELLKDYTDKVMKGDLEPDQAEQAMTQQGYTVPKGYFHTLQPSVSHGLEQIVGRIGKAETPQTVPGPLALQGDQAVKRLPMRLGKFDSPSQPLMEEGAPPTTLDSTQMQPDSPEFRALLNIRNEKLDSFAPTKIDDVDASGVKRTAFVPSRPDSLTGRTFQTEPTPAQAGRMAGTRAVTEQQTTNDLGFPQLKGQAFASQEGVERPAKVETAGQSARRTAQEGVNVSTDPANVAKEARKVAIMTDATTRASHLASMLPPEIAQNVANNLVSVTATNRPYAFIDPGTPADIREAAYRVLTAPTDTLPTGVKIVNKDQHAALQAIDKARADYDSLMKRFAGHLPRDAQGRLVSGPQNTIGAYLQSDPELAAAIGTSFPLVLENLKANAGTIGRVMQIEVDKMKDSIPKATDTYRTAQLKRIAMAEYFQNSENSILGHPRAK